MADEGGSKRSNFLKNFCISIPLLVHGALVIGLTLAYCFLSWHIFEATSDAAASAMDAALEHVAGGMRPLLEANRSAVAVANALPVTTNQSSLSYVGQTLLVTAFAMQPAVAEMSYAGPDGAAFTCYRAPNGQPGAMFKGRRRRWFTQAADPATGRLVGPTSPVPRPAQHLQPNYTAQVIADIRAGSHASLRAGWARPGVRMVVFSAQTGAGGVVSAAVPIDDVVLTGGAAAARIASGFRLLHVYYALSSNNHSASSSSLSTGYRSFVPESHSHSAEEMEGLFEKVKCTASAIDAPKLAVHDVGPHSYTVACTNFDVSGVNLGIRLVLRDWHEAATFRRMGVALACLVCATVVLAVLTLLVTARSMRRSAAREAALGADLARHREAVQQAERKSMNKSNAIASASHDIRSALAAVAGLIYVSRPEARGNPVLAENLSQMDVCTKKLLDILNSILDMGKVESGKMQLEEVEFSMAQVLEESVDMANVTGMAKGIEVVWDPCDFSVLRCGAVVGDCKRVKQILDNLLGNAMKFTHEGNVVLRAWANRPIASGAGAGENSGCGGAPSRLAGGLFRRWKKDVCADRQNSAGPKSLRNDPDSVEFYLEVTDTGVGIPMEKRQSVFENYVQVKEGHGGTGLGLGIVQSFVRLMGGEISIKDKEPGEAGTCFGLNVFMKLKERPAETVEITVDQGPSSSSSDVHESRLFREASCFKGLHCVLLVHGGETRRILQAWMETLGMKVWLAPGAEQLAAALDKATTGASHAGGDGAATGDLCFIPREMLPMARRNSSGRGAGAGGHHHAFGLLVVVDMTDGGFDAVCRAAAASFARIRDQQFPCRLVCLTDPKTSSRDLLRFKQAITCDLELRKPIHGSRLSKLLATMKDLHQSYYSPPQNPHHTSQVSPGIKGKEVEQIRTSAASSEIEELPVEPPRPKVDTESKPLEGMRVLLAEDNRVLQCIQEKMLTMLGATVAVAQNGAIAVAMFKSALEEAIGASSQGSAGAPVLPYDVVFMDCQMPEMNGYEATRRIREEESVHGIRTPIIALTAHSLEEGLQEATEAGMDLHLSKPVQKEKIVEAVYQICN